MRYLAFSLLLAAAFDWSVPWLDRVGAAAAGFACLALALPPSHGLLRRPARMTLPPKRVELPELDAEPEASLAQRIAAYELADESAS